MDHGLAAGAEMRADLDFAGFAQEFLRRNPDYAREYRTIGDAPPDEQEVMARRWGLCFPVPAQSAAGRRAGTLACYTLSGDGHSGRRAAGIRRVPD